MPRPYIYISVAAILILTIFTINNLFNDKPVTQPDALVDVSELDGTQDQVQGDLDTGEPTSDTAQVPLPVSNGKFSAPMSDWASRVNKKTFGTYVTPTSSPVTLEKFTGYHAAIDLEILSSEEDSEVPVLAICNGKLAIKKQASGYGGLVAQYCDYNGIPVLVLYGHVALSSVDQVLGQEIKTGEQLAVLGQPGTDTDGERKHLHLGVRKGQELVIAGYVPNQTSLSSYYDPRELLQ